MKEEVNSAGDMENTFLKDLKKNNFLVPDNYFDGLHQKISSQIKLESYKKDSAFDIPSAYFENMEKDILAQVRLDNQLSKTTATEYNVPDGYFDSLHDKITAQISEKQIKEIPLQKTRVIKLSFIKYAAAILLVSSVALGLFYKNSVSFNGTQNVNENISKLNDQEIIDYLNTYSDSNDIQFIIEHTDDISTIEQNISHL